MGLWMVGVVLAACVSADGCEPTAPEPNALFREGFDNDRLLRRGWYDGQRFKISAEAFAGRAEYCKESDRHSGQEEQPVAALSVANVGC